MRNLLLYCLCISLILLANYWITHGGDITGIGIITPEPNGYVQNQNLVFGNAMSRIESFLLLLGLGLSVISSLKFFRFRRHNSVIGTRSWV